jgi:sulfatase maturation enzyme AslB (radical SAM superfamily)
MAGAMAGTATLHFGDPSSRLRVVTLTVNNVCNLRCPHCYLQYLGESNFMEPGVAAEVMRHGYEHLAIVGKEPLVDRKSANQCAELIAGCLATGKSVSVITNGLGLPFLDATALQRLRWIDLSLDGGPESYSRYRKGSYARIIENLGHVRSNSATPVNALHVLSDTTVDRMGDMMAIRSDFDFNRIVFSPYQETRNDGLNVVSSLPLNGLLTALSECTAFLDEQSAFLLLGPDTFLEQGYHDEAVIEMVHGFNLRDKVRLIPHDPLMLGFVRVTYDGMVLSPKASLHPSEYHLWAKNLREKPLREIYQELRSAA